VAVIGSTDLGDGRLALTVDVDPVVSFPPEAGPGDLINYDGVWYRADSSSSAIPEINLHQHLHQLDGLDPVGRITPEAGGIPAAGVGGEIDKDWYPVFIGSGATAAKGAVPEPPATPGTDLFLREDGAWKVPGGSEILVSGIITTEGGLVYTRNKYTGGPIELVVQQP
jgi:hypothetical protein